VGRTLGNCECHNGLLSIGARNVRPAVTATVLCPESRATGTQTPDCRECSVGELPGSASIGNHPSVTLDSATLAASPEAVVRAGGLNRVLVGAAVGLAVVSICCCLIVVPWHRWLAARADINPLGWVDLLMAVVWPTVGALLVRSQPRNPVGWLMVVPALLGPYQLLAHYAVTSALLGYGSWPAATLATWLAVWGLPPTSFQCHWWLCSSQTAVCSRDGGGRS
jgi:hypothetical protein